MRSPFLGLKFCSDFFGVRDFGKDVFLGLTKSETHWQTIVSVSFTKERWMQKLSGILLNNYYFFLIGLFGFTFWAVGIFLGQGLA